MLSSCATSNYSRGVSYLNKDEYTQAIQSLEAAEQEKPEDYRIKRELGVAYFKMGQRLRASTDVFDIEPSSDDKAIAKLQEAKGINAKDSKTVFYLGLAYESRNMIGEAIEEYKNYRTLSRSGGFKNEISKRIKQLTNEKISKEIATAIANEENLDVTEIPDNTIAVLYFQNLSSGRELDPLQKGLAQMLITDLSKVKQLTVLERIKLQRLLEELELGSTGFVDEKTAPRVGKLIGAKKLVMGGFTELSEGQLRIDASLAETATSKILEVDEITGKLEALFDLEKKLALSIIDDLGIELTKEEQEAIRKKPTESLLAFIAYSKGLDFEDRGLFDQAEAAFQKAVAIDPNFQQAKEGFEEVKVAKKAATEPKLANLELENEFEETISEVTGTSTSSRLLETSVAAQTGQTPQGDNDTRESVAEDTGGNKITNAKLGIRIPLPKK